MLHKTKQHAPVLHKTNQRAPVLRKMSQHAPVPRKANRRLPALHEGVAAGREGRQRFENWKLRRALRRPYFLRSTTRGSRVRKPWPFRVLRSAGS